VAYAQNVIMLPIGQLMQHDCILMCVFFAAILKFRVDGK